MSLTKILNRLESKQAEMQSIYYSTKSDNDIPEEIKMQRHSCYYRETPNGRCQCIFKPNRNLDFCEHLYPVTELEEYNERTNRPSKFVVDFLHESTLRAIERQQRKSLLPRPSRRFHEEGHYYDNRLFDNYEPAP